MAQTAENYVEYQMAHYDESQIPLLITVLFIGFVVTVSAVALRFWSRKLLKAKYQADDWTILAALVSVSPRWPWSHSLPIRELDKDYKLTPSR
jgi:hypothetical protein